ncbi:unnamed protein product [Spodoptera littoralis]|uniref:Uncharacterized protein n=1 Tax=Spodoptera littoralis TaxID=7109 RepID=A0A9P0N8R2_SPOLI|nr:unnamed protein product [Spodoptera littoralis]CAH1645620.1 unnamed protein product [Spodoptera littoralis]
MSSERYKFLISLKEDAITRRQVVTISPSDGMDSPPRQDTPVHFSKYFTDEDLQKVTEIIENSDEEKSAHDNDCKTTVCSMALSSMIRKEKDPVLSPPEVNSYDPILAPAPIMLKSPIMSNISSGIENDVSIESPNFSSVIAQEIAQLESVISPVPTTPLSLPVNSPMPIETQLSVTENTVTDIVPSPRHRHYMQENKIKVDYD